MASLDELMDTGENPIRVVRHMSGLSIRQAAEKIRCHYQTVYMSEHGMFIPCPPVMLHWAMYCGPWGLNTLQIAYYSFQTRKRKESQQKHSIGSLTIECLGFPDENPIRNLRKFLNLTQSGFCKEFCIPVSWLHDAENVASVFPQRLESIMGKIGFPKTLLEEISWRYDR